MKSATSLLVAFSFAAALCAGPAFAADAPAKQLTPQQQKMKDCNANASTQKLAGDARKAFMSSCLKGDSAAAAAPAAPVKPMTQQEKMKSCNADAGTQHLAGDARKAFMSNCLKGSPAAAAPAH